jgi:hypothetical protein
VIKDVSDDIAGISEDALGTEKKYLTVGINCLEYAKPEMPEDGAGEGRPP